MMVTGAVVACFGLVGAAGLTANATPSASAYEYGQKSVVCHKGRTIVVDGSSLGMHLAHGDSLGPCA